MADSSPPVVQSPAPELAIPDDIRKTMAEGVLTSFEDATAYEKLILLFAQDVQPDGHIEWLWVKDIADCTWDIYRARRAKAACLAMGRRDALRTLQQAFYPDPIASLDAEFVAREDEVEDMLDKLERGVEPDSDGGEDLSALPMMLHRFGLTETSLQDIAYSNLLPKMEGFDRLIDNAMSRRASIVREIDRRREVGRRMRQAIQSVDEAIDAEFE